MTLTIDRIGFALGARVTGVDLSRRLDSGTVAALRAAWLEHQALVFPGQDLDARRFLDVARCFGELETIRAAGRDPELPNIGYITNLPGLGRDPAARPGGLFKNGEEWHSDENYTTRPTSATFLLAKQLPPVGGDTMFANQYLAYETLSPRLQQIVDELEVVQSIPKRSTPPDPDERPAVHPMVRVHPETGRRALFLGARAEQIVGMTVEESAPLLDYLNRHAVRYEFCYRHRWTLGDLVMWDNRCLLHIALRDYDHDNEPRHLFRAACVGEESGRLYDPALEDAFAPLPA
jgi:taurine dioxygenase